MENLTSKRTQLRSRMAFHVNTAAALFTCLVLTGCLLWADYKAPPSEEGAPSHSSDSTPDTSGTDEDTEVDAGETPDASPDADVDTDTDIDGDVDSDTDGDSDTDTDSGSDSDSETETSTSTITEGNCEGWLQNAAGLCWENPPQGTYITWQQAADHCSELAADDPGWRLPTIVELRSIVSGCPATEFGGACPIGIGSVPSQLTDECEGCDYTSQCYSQIPGICVEPPTWSSTTYTDDTEYAWLLQFSVGRVISGKMESPDGSVRCVRTME